MIEDMDKDGEELDPRLRDLAQSYHQPPAPPRDEMWRAIQAGRQRAQTPAGIPDRAPVRLRPAARRWPVPLAIAAILLLGMAIGRLIPRPTGTPAPAPVASADTTPARSAGRTSDAAYRLVMTQHLAQSETFLTLFRASVRSGSLDEIAPAAAQRLLASNRLLIDSRASDDAKVRLLLQDLELVLAQIAQLSPSPSREREDLDLISDGIEQGAVLVRLRAAVPPGGPSTRLAGAL